MCGIAGIYSKGEKRISRDILETMCIAMRHRGPDDDGFYVDRKVGLAMRRLSIIDIKTGKQPIHNEDKTIWVILNGEIYNYKELRKKLGNNHSFYTKTDTEVLVHLYEEHGENFLNMLNGMFAFALWDFRKQTLYIARDRLGIKPLYYIDINGQFIFASEINCILTVPGIPREIDLGALQAYFSFLYTPAPLTMLKKIRKLKPGNMIILKNGKVELKKYWEMEYRDRKWKKLDTLIEDFLETFKNSVKRQLISDVPLGAFLSGGIDSSAIVSVMSESLEKPVETFSIGYGQEEAYFDERQDARLIVDRYHTSHHEFELKPGIIDIVPQIIQSLDEPLGDASVIPNYFLSQQTREFVTVALSGLGGDELCAGYPRYAGMYLANYYKRIPKIIREKFISNIVLNLPDSKKGRRFIDRAKRFTRFGDLPSNTAYFNMISSFDREDKHSLMSDHIKKGINDRVAETIFDGYFYQHKNESLLNRIFFTDMKLYLVDDLLTLTDKMSMAHSLEVRVPFLDNELIDFMASVSPELKLKRMTKKFLLKKSFDKILPRRTLYKEKKGFSVPLVLWFRRDLRSFIDNFLSKERIENLGYFNWAFIRNLLDLHFSGKANYYIQIWGLLVFCLWHAIHIEGQRILEDIWNPHFRRQ